VVASLFARRLLLVDHVGLGLVCVGLRPVRSRRLCVGYRGIVSLGRSFFAHRIRLLGLPIVRNSSLVVSLDGVLRWRCGRGILSQI
jgi:hypothetical protein